MTHVHHDATLITIGGLARRSGLSVRTLRFYSDRGLVAPAGRSQAGYRLYDEAAPARAELVRTLRELGVDLPTIARVLGRELNVPGVAAAHVAAIDAQIQVLRLQRAVLQVAAKRETTPKEMRLMHDLARLSADQRRHIVTDFVEGVFDGVDADPGIAKRMRSAAPDLPAEPTTEQIEAWIELAELVRDDDFRRRIRQMAVRSAAERAAAPDGADSAAHVRMAQAVAQRAGGALAAGIGPTSAQARPIVDELAAVHAEIHGRTDDGAFRVWLAEVIETFADVRAERYWQLLGIMNGWPQRPPTAPAWQWLARGLRTWA